VDGAQVPGNDLALVGARTDVQTALSNRVHGAATNSVPKNPWRVQHDERLKRPGLDTPPSQGLAGVREIELTGKRGKCFTMTAFVDI